MLTYIDSNNNEMMDGGDYLDIEGLTYPGTESGAYTYLLLINREIDSCPIEDPIILGYIVLFKGGPVSIIDGNAPYSNMKLESTPDNGIKRTVEYVSREVSLETPTEMGFINADSTLNFWEFDYYQASTEINSYMNFSRKISDPPFDLDLFFCFVDQQDNGLFDKDDYLIILPTNGTRFMNNTELSAAFNSTDIESIYYHVFI